MNGSIDRLRLPLLAILMLTASGIDARPGGRAAATPEIWWQVELIVFEYPEGRSDRRPVDAPVAYTGAAELTALAGIDEAMVRPLGSLARLFPALGGSSAAWLQTGDIRIAPLPKAWQPATLSEPMRRALGRLEDSPDHQPVIAMSWFQPRVPRRRAVGIRIHDQPPIQEWSPPGTQPLPAGTDIGRGPAPEPSDPTAPKPDTPDPEADGAELIYRIDGVIQAYFDQFPRLALDLVLQEPPNPFATGLEANTRWLLHRLQQSRAVRPDRFEYFDSSRLGVLARITEFERTEPEPEPETDTEPDADTTEAGRSAPDAGPTQ